MNKRKVIVTHSGSFHTDDIFAVATLFLHFGEDACEIVRTRDEALIEKGDIVVDVGGVYDADNERFDHHQPGGAGERENGIPYASFGLVWKKYAPLIADSVSVAERIERILVQPIDAGDNGIDLVTPLRTDLRPVTVGHLTSFFRPTWKESAGYDDAFLLQVRWAEGVMRRVCVVAAHEEEACTVIARTYQDAPDKRLIIIPETYHFGRELTTSVLIAYPEPLYALLYRYDVDSWQVVAINETLGTYRTRKPLPMNWAGKRGAELAAITGVPDAIFCHNGRFMCMAKSKEGAMRLAQLALNS